MNNPILEYPADLRLRKFVTQVAWAAVFYKNFMIAAHQLDGVAAYLGYIGKLSFDDSRVLQHTAELLREAHNDPEDFERLKAFCEEARKVLDLH